MSDDAPAESHVWAVIPAGGAGTRLWPLSRAAAPKFLRDLTGTGRSLLQQTVDRVTPIVGERTLVVTGRAHRDAVAAQLPELPSACVVAEPSPRDSMAAIGLAAAMIERDDPDAVLGSFAADHVIRDEDRFRACVREAVRVAEAGYLVTIGIEPTYPSTGFGYIEAGGPAEVDGAPTARVALTFVEKPDLARATGYLASGRFRWNAGMFVVRAGRLLDLLARWHPDLASGLREVAAAPERLEEVWPTLTRISIDHAVAEPAAERGRVAVVPGAFDWDDVGDFAALAGLIREGRSRPEGAITVLGDPAEVVGVDASGFVAAGGDRVVALVGVDDVVVVDTPDAVLVVRRDRAQDVKRVVESLREGGRSDLL